MCSAEQSKYKPGAISVKVKVEVKLFIAKVDPVKVKVKVHSKYKPSAISVTIHSERESRLLGNLF